MKSIRWADCVHRDKKIAKTLRVYTEQTLFMNPMADKTWYSALKTMIYYTSPEPGVKVQMRFKSIMRTYISVCK